MILKGALFLLMTVAVNAYRNTFMVTAPKKITFGQSYTVSVNILQAKTPVNVEITILLRRYINRRYVKDPVVTVTEQFNQSNPRAVTLQVPRVAVTGSCYLKVKGSGGLVFEREQYLSINYKTASVYLQTDKAIYKPGQTVRFRVLTVFPDLMVYNGAMTVEVYDPNRNRIRRWKSISEPTGVCERDLLLSDQPTLGNWRIEVSVPEFTHLKKSISFQVKQYELPKFEVTVKLPPFALTSDITLSGTITANYTFGKGVKGTVELRVYVGNMYTGYCGALARSVNKAYEIDGSVEFSVPVADIRRIRHYITGQSITVVAEVKEELTGKTFNGTSKVRFYQQPYKISFMESSSDTFKPELPYRAYLKVEQQDGRPVTDLRERVKIYTCVEYERNAPDQYRYACGRFTGTYGLPMLELEVPEDGIVPVDIDIPEEIVEIKIKAYYKAVSVSKTVYQSQSPSKTFIQARLTTMDLKAGDEAVFEIQGTSQLESVFYEISSRGIVVDSGIMSSKHASKPNTLVSDIVTLNTMSPTANLLVYYIGKNGEIVADSISFNVEGVFENQVSIDFSKAEAEPRTDITVNVKANINSTAYLLAVDKSVLLLRSGNDITKEKVMDELGSYNPSSYSVRYAYWRYPVPVSGQNAQQIFQNAQVLVITDALLHSGVRRSSRYNNYQNYYPSYPEHGGYPYGGYPMTTIMYEYMPTMAYDRSYAASPPPVQLKEVEFTRDVFPETWLWESTKISSASGEKVQVTVPDTVTSWIASAFAVNKESGLGVAPTTAKLKTFLSFFVTLNLPRSVVKGEQAIVQVKLFNYLGSNRKVRVQLKPNDDFESDDSNKPQIVEVVDGKPTAVYFSVTPKSFGMVDIEVSAQTTDAADAVKRQLNVKPEGIRKESNTPVLIHLTPKKKTFRKRVGVYLPSLVPGSLKMRLSVTGDILGPTIGNLEDLIALPTGCGEQTLLKFAPDIYIADYLRATNQMTPQLEAKIKAYLEVGYQRLLSYQRRDRSFSPFGESDEAGSVWLTSFMVKVLYQASRYIDIDSYTIDSAVNWLLTKQTDQGDFVEPGRVIDRHLQGRNGAGPALTSYVLLALDETSNRNGSRVNVGRLQQSIQKAVDFLDRLSFESLKTHDLSITTYALVRLNSTNHQIAFNLLLQKSTTRRGIMYWDINAGSSKVESIDILTTSFALMSFISLEKYTEGMNIVQWLTSKKSRRGGFISSQDTSLALEALTKYLAAVQPKNYKVDVTVKVYTSRTNFTTFEKTIDKSNALVVHSYELSSRPRYLVIEAKGEGMTVVEVGSIYNVKPRRSSRYDMFDINTVVLKEDVNDFTLMICAKHLSGGSSGMCVQSIQIPSGFTADLSDGANVAGLKRLEQNGETVVAYFDEIGTSSSCFPLSCSRTNLVVNNKKAYISMVDYYNNVDSVGTVTSYLPRSLKYADRCDICEDCDGCKRQ